MKTFTFYFLVCCSVFAIGLSYHLALVWLASIFSWEGTAIGLSLITFMAGIFFTGVGRTNKEYDEVYAENRIEALLAQQEADRKLIRELKDELSYQKSIVLEEAK